jgi:hypothetical protein
LIKFCALLSLLYLGYCQNIQAQSDTISAPVQLKKIICPIYFLDEREIDYLSVKKIDPKTIGKIEYQKASDAARGYGIKGRFGIIKIATKKKQASLKIVGFYSFTIYIAGDTAKYLKQVRYSGKDLDTLFPFRLFNFLLGFTKNTLIHIYK